MLFRSIDIDGRSAAHTININVVGNDLGVVAKAEANFDSQGWAQRWSILNLSLPDQILLGLEQTLGVRLTTTSIIVNPFCLRGGKNSSLTDAATLCGSGRRDDAGWTAEAAASRLPMASLLPAPTAKAQYLGSVNAALNLRSSEKGLPRGDARVDFVGAGLRWQRAGGRQDVIPLGSGSLVLQSSDEGLLGKLDIAADQRGRASGEL